MKENKQKQFKERIDCGIAYCEDTPNKQIEKMTKDIPYLTLNRTVFVSATETKNVSWMLSEEDNKLIAESLVVKGYRNCKDKVVLIKSEKEKLLKEMYEQGKFDAIADLEKNGKVVLTREEYQNDFSNQFNKGYEKGSKETAREIIVELLDCEILKVIRDMGWESISNDITKEILELAKQYGVEIE